MKKGIIFTLIIASVLVFSGCFNKDSAKDTGSSKGGALESNPIADLFTAGKKMKCTYTDESTGSESTTYYEGEKFRSEGEFSGKKSYTVSDGKVVYTWFDDKTGTKMDLECMEGLSDDSEFEEDFTEFDETSDFQDPQEMAELQQDFKCEEVSSIDFSIPSDVKFEDMCEQMKQQVEALKQFEGQLPADFGIE